MNRYYYETPERNTAWRVFDRMRGAPDSYASLDSRAMALCEKREDAALIVDALNTRALLVDSVDR